MSLLRKIFRILLYVLALFSLFYIICFNAKIFILNNIETDKIDLFFKQYENDGNNIQLQNSDNYNMVIEIPKINLKKGIYNLYDFRNNIESNVTVLNYEIINQEIKNLIIAAHSGNNYNAYFKDLSKLKIGDEVIIYYQNYKYNYEINNIYIKSKIENYYIIDNPEDIDLVLVTCRDNYNYLILEAKRK